MHEHSDSTSTTFQPFFLNFYKVHSLALHFFLRMWNESGSSTGDFPRLVALTRSQYVILSAMSMSIQSCLPCPATRFSTFIRCLLSFNGPLTSIPHLRVKVALKRENIRPWHEVEQEFLECEYRAVRDRQMQELEMEDDIMSKIPIR